MKKYISMVVFIGFILFMTRCGSDDKAVAKDTKHPIAVKVATVTLDNNSPFLSVSGKVQATKSANLSTRMMGFVNKVYVGIGDKVKKGQLLMSINNADLQAKRAQVNASITEATAAFNSAEKDYNRFKNLFVKTSATQKELDDMTANFEMAKARLEAANQMKNEINSQFKYSNITAPFNGVVTGKFIETGDMANPGIPLIAIEASTFFEVMAMVPESEISQIKSGTEVNVLIKSIDKTIKGIVTEVSSSAKNTGGQYLVKVALAKTTVPILSGMFATVQFPIESETFSSFVLVPSEAIVTRGQLSGIYTVSQSNTAILRWLRLGRTFGDQVEVLSGLTEDESYIVSADGKLFNGVKISIE
ncbi:efflux RND transporter periplasmic adaptor subunit [Dokdonia ponticola]|uniref:Efflux RND transporter periplasmic adaptor subunit n=1 Tax=Dokdonia ponticola TaxID=2041041 RepID=A0ABV9HS31_9FLAO